MGLTERRKREQITNSTSTAGSANAAKLKLAEFRGTVEVFYDISVDNGDIVIEVSEDESTWRELNRTSSLNTGGDWISPQDTTYTYARVYASSGFADGDISVIEISAGE